MSLGVYPKVTLKEARFKREEAKTLLAQGIDPSAQRKAVKIMPEDGLLFNPSVSK